MEKNRVFYSNLFAMILLILYSVGGRKLIPIFTKLKLSLPVYLVMPQILLLLVPTIIYFVLTRQSVIETLRLKKIGVKTIFIVIAIGLIAMPIATFLSLITQFVFPNRIGQIVSELDNIPFIIRLGVIALTPAICEEITYRGIILAGYDNIAIRKSAIMTGLFFGIIHMDGNQFLYAFALGVIFAYLVRITGSIFSSMICHFVINGTQLFLAELSTFLLKSSNEGVKAAQQAGLSALTTSEKINLVLVYLILAVICTGIVIILIQKLIKIHGRRGMEPKELHRNDEKVINWPVYVTVILYVYIIVNQLIFIYK
ncbi:CPBP family intramembrane glutamic endopeptidase [Clostridium sp. ZS2-4]|uniref:CPBP family intramembrane glutamic endopeptidase n=1 Tax=Clostridium sp. ZS2-4 TaxID=2987703 RepID=UPI00227CE123|nr:type II CAAX endopeptidase family protein [Clostridium sp. ZS2-4]MCY6355600.1 type II CAAX endopeptidase family protein [Clostridium sp. ZS2-4]